MAGNNPSHIQTLIEQTTRRLKILEIQAAKKGEDCPPHIKIEIEDLKKANAELQEKLDNQKTPQQSAKTLIRSKQESCKKQPEELGSGNRDLELNQFVLNPTSPQFLEIYATAGYGKTHLLEKAIEWYKSQEDTVWAFVSFYKPSLRSSKENVINTITTKINGQLSTSIPSTSIPNEPISEFITQFTKEKNIKNVVLLFDDSEFATDDLVKWIKNTLIPDFTKGLAKQNILVKVIFSGKYPRPELKPYNPHYKFQHVRLRTFDARTIKEMVEESAASVGARLENRQFEEIARYGLELTSGHPKSIKQLIGKLASWGFDNFETVFTEKKKEIFADILDTVETEIIAEATIQVLTRQIRHVLEPICIFRRFLPGNYTIKPLLDRGFIPDLHYSPDEIFEKLASIPLVTWQDRMYVVDSLVRRTLSLKMKLFNHELFEEITSFAIQLYDSWIIGKDFNGNDYPFKSPAANQIDFIDENFYHRFQLLHVQGKNTKADFEELKEKMKHYCECLATSQDQNHQRINVQLLRLQMLEDIELQELLYTLFGDAFDGLLSV